METIDAKRFISSGDPFNKVYTALRNNLIYFARNRKVIGLTSCNNEEENSMVSLNLAISMAEAGIKVLLIELERFEKKRSIKVCDGKLKVGASECLTVNKPMEKMIYQTEVKNLHLIIFDKVFPNSYGLPLGEALENLIKELSEQYDYILFDIPSFHAVREMEDVIKVCEGIVIIVKSNSVSYESGRRFKKELEQMCCPILGAVLYGG